MTGVIKSDHALHRPAAKAVHGLVVVTHNDKIVGRPPRQLEVDGFLHRVGILILVDQCPLNATVARYAITLQERLPQRRLQELEKTSLQLRKIAAIGVVQMLQIFVVKTRKYGQLATRSAQT